MQEELSNRFAKSGEQKFKGIQFETGLSSTPLLANCAARLQCKTSFRYEGGDHVIFVGEVVDFERSEIAPLIYHAGKYGVATHTSPRLSLGTNEGKGVSSDFNEDVLDYLLGRAQLDFELCVNRSERQHGISRIEQYTLLALISGECRGVQEMEALMTPAGRITRDVVAGMMGRGWVRAMSSAPNERWSLTEQGRKLALERVAWTKAVESDVLDRIGHANAVSLKNLLKLLIVKIDSGVPHPWGFIGEESETCRTG